VKNGLLAGPGFGSKLECVPVSFRCCTAALPQGEPPPAYSLASVEVSMVS